MRRIKQALAAAAGTMSMTAVLTLNLFLIVFLVLALITVLVLLGADGGFFYQNGQVTVGGALTALWSVCLIAAAAMVFAVRATIIRPIRQMMDAMDELASGDFSVRVPEEPGERRWMPREIRAFAKSFNRTAGELGGTELLKKDFINNFSHEFKTPIVSISGFADLLLEEGLTEEERREFLTIIRDESRRLAELSSHVLTLNRVESQTILTDRAPFRLDEQLRQCALVTGQRWREKQPAIGAELPDCVYNGSEALLKEVWLNLLDNAAKFSEPGGEITVTLDRSGSSVAVTVADRGAGMDEETRRHIFEQFYQGDTSHRTQGNGLGLALVKKIVELHGGIVEVVSAPGAGSRFTVTLPAET